ncbi:MAG: hypothetical protein NXI04_08130 [Planctomycetaceae bacterium]|nr:hypothetical protein [Planctomycetaceae bacterium]
MKTIAYLSMVVAAAALAVFMARDIVADLGHTPDASARTTVDVEPAAPVTEVASTDAASGDVNRSETAGKPDVVQDELQRIRDLRQQAQEQSQRLDEQFAVEDFHDTDPITQSEEEIRADDGTATEAAAPSHSLTTSAPVRQQTPLHPQLITPGNFEYLGGFRPEFGDGNGSRFGLGGWAIAYRADGDPSGPDDGHPGSLFLMGHEHQQLIAEINIPRPVVSPHRDINRIPEAKILQPFADITKGIRGRMTAGSSEPFKIGGMQVVGNRLHWTIYKYYNVSRVDYLSHGLTSTDLSSDAVRGLWHLGPQNGGSRWHSYKNAGYIAEIPAGIADGYLDGRNLMSGLQISTGRQTSSQGPALYAYRVTQENLSPGASLDAVPLLWYPMDAPMTGHHPADSWQGAAWLTLGKKQAVVVVGRKGLGPVHYGMPRPGECYDYKGYHASAYEVQMLFYDPRQILAGAKRAVPNKDPWYRWNGQTPGGSLNRFMYQDCGKEIGGMAYDRERNLLYLSEVDAAKAAVNDYEELPVIHVLKLVE